MAATRADLLRIAPELSPGVSDADLDGFLADAALELDPTRWGGLYNRAQALLAAHLATLAHPEVAGPAGPVASEAVGGVSVAYAVSAPTAGRWGTTRHGVELTRLLRQLGPGATVI